jgi:hypothetical protein
MSLLSPSFGQKMEATAGFLKMSVPINQTIKHHIPEDQKPLSTIFLPLMYGYMPFPTSETQLHLIY